nr:MAG TPA: hypothetical protein [Caudoviricetes sp.]
MPTNKASVFLQTSYLLIAAAVLRGRPSFFCLKLWKISIYRAVPQLFCKVCTIYSTAIFSGYCFSPEKTV